MIKIELARHFGEVLSPEETNVDFKQENNGADIRIHGIVAHKHCPFCGNLENIHFLESALFNFDDDDIPFPRWIKMPHECSKCHIWWMVAARINKEEEE